MRSCRKLMFMILPIVIMLGIPGPRQSEAGRQAEGQRPVRLAKKTHRIHGQGLVDHRFQILVQGCFHLLCPLMGQGTCQGDVETEQIQHMVIAPAQEIAPLPT